MPAKNIYKSMFLMIIYFRIIDATIRGAQKIVPVIAGNR
jgi:hypothetical protein